MAGAAEFTDPVAYPAWLWWAAIVPPLLVLGWYLTVWLWAHGRLTRRPRRSAVSPRAAHLARLDEVEAAVAAGRLPLREAHQQISEIVRSYVTATGSVDARVLDLEQLRAVGPTGAVDVVALVYPPEFAPADQGSPAERFPRALAAARRVVASHQDTGGAHRA